MTYPGFKERGLEIVVAFDSDARKIGKEIKGIIVESIDKIPQTIAKKNVSIAIIAVPAKEAQALSDALVSAGVECILNFAPTSLNVPEHIKAKDVDLSRELETLSYFLANKKATKE